MSVELSREIWDELKRYVNVVDRDEAAETLVSVLIDNDADADEIKSDDEEDDDTDDEEDDDTDDEEDDTDDEEDDDEEDDY